MMKDIIFAELQIVLVVLSPAGLKWLLMRTAVLTTTHSLVSDTDIIINWIIDVLNWNITAT